VEKEETKNDIPLIKSNSPVILPRGNLFSKHKAFQTNTDKVYEYALENFLNLSVSTEEESTCSSKNSKKSSKIKELLYKDLDNEDKKVNQFSENRIRKMDGFNMQMGKLTFSQHFNSGIYENPSNFESSKRFKYLDRGEESA
jgi:hypothetical protein